MSLELIPESKKKEETLKSKLTKTIPLNFISFSFYLYFFFLFFFSINLYVNIYTHIYIL